MKWIHSKEKKPTVTGTYFGKYNGNELCFIYVAGGEVYKLRFTNTAEFSSGFRDMNKIEYEWLDESLSTETGQPTYTAAQIRQAGKEGEVNHLDVEHIIDLLKEQSDGQKEPLYSLQDLLDAAQYGFRYHRDSQNDGKEVPRGNILQWLMNKKGLTEVPESFKVETPEQDELWEEFREQWVSGQIKSLMHSGFSEPKAMQIAPEQWQEQVSKYLLIKK